ncbi:hypothetical protein [Acidiphilium acidophilum]|uniref:hypothetical protein n=1 Tax=Acidiphilium acidophilum TaxID=76588 RepID=UPI002E8E75A5|nr:hypothetical protein [Acidiphilium acidophilum]
MTQNALDAEIFGKIFKITTVQVMNGATGLLGGMANNADEFKAMMDEFLAGFGAYLTGLTEAQKAELYALLAQQQA